MMIHEIPIPKISPAFTIADIHKIREWDYERLKDATPEEYYADIERRAEEARKKFGLKTGLNTPNTEPHS